MRPIGFSTGALTRGDFLPGLALLRGLGIRQVELSALREEELSPLLAWLDGRTLDDFDYVSVHAPSRFRAVDERGLVELLLPLRDRGWPIIVHADLIAEPAVWRVLGRSLCLENTDKRKPSGRGVAEVGRVFAPLPDATFCLDLGHARQVDPTMGQAYFMLKEFGGRLRQVHLSEVDTRSHHDRLSEAAAISFRQIAEYVPADVPIILESMVRPDAIDDEINFARHALPVAGPSEARDDPRPAPGVRVRCA